MKVWRDLRNELNRAPARVFTCRFVEEGGRDVLRAVERDWRGWRKVGELRDCCCIRGGIWYGAMGEVVGGDWWGGGVLFELFGKVGVGVGETWSAAAVWV